MTGQAFVGTSGWNYQGWRDLFYQGRPASQWLSFCAERFTGIEVNATFYRLQPREVFQRWRRATPRDFRFTIKANRYLTHNKKLNDPLPAIRTEREGAAGLGDKLAAVVWQLPSNLHKDLRRLDRFARALHSWRSVRHAIELRHPSWFDDEVAACLSHHRIAVCQSDAADWPLWDRITTDLVYIRLHGHTQTYASAYSDEQLQALARYTQHWTRTGCDVHIYFDNDSQAHAPRNALRLLELLGTR
jgi:uncharacterized protein YecE (DUF72 family)